VRHDQAGFIHHHVSHQQQIQIKRSRRIRKQSLASAFLFNRQQRAKELSGRRPARTDGGRIQVGRLLVGDVNRSGGLV
jgi:hypothetical protein